MASWLGLSTRTRMLAALPGLLMLSPTERDALRVFGARFCGSEDTSAVSNSTSFPSCKRAEETVGGAMYGLSSWCG